MARQALLFANNLGPGFYGKGTPAGTIKRTLDHLKEVLEGLSGAIRFSAETMIDARPTIVRAKAVKLAAKAEQTDSLFLLFYFGHASIGPQNELHFENSHEKGKGENPLTLETLENVVSECRVKRSIFLLDCCHAGTSKWEFQPPRKGEHCRIGSTTACGYAFVKSNSVDEPTGVFTQALIDAFNSKEATVSVADNSITTESLFRFVSDDVKKRTSSVQEPVMVGGLREQLSIYEPNPEIVQGVNVAANPKTTYRKIYAIIELLGRGRPRDGESFHNRIIREHPDEFKTLVKYKDGTLRYVEVDISVTLRYLRFLEKLKIVGADRLSLTPMGRRVAQGLRTSFSELLLERIDEYLNELGIERSDIDKILRRILGSRSIPTKSAVLEYLVLGKPSIVKEDLGTILDLLGYIRAIRMSDGRAYFAW